MKGFKNMGKGGCSGHDYPSNFGFTGSSKDHVVVKGHTRSAPKKSDQKYAAGGRVAGMMSRAVGRALPSAPTEVELPAPTVDQVNPVPTAAEGVIQNVYSRRLARKPVGQSTLASVVASATGPGVIHKAPRGFGRFNTKPMFK